MRTNDRILAVDDHKDNLLILKEILSDEFSLACASSGPEAIRMAPPFRPNLILLDVMMPELDGIQTCRLLRAMPQLADAKIVMLSARSEIKDRLAAYEVGAVDYMVKPFDEREVLAKVRAWMQMVHREQVDRIWNEAEQAGEATGSALVTLAAFRDTESAGHLFRVRWYALAIAEQLAHFGPYQRQVDDVFVQRLDRASPLHDIGKVGIAGVLKKSGRIDASDLKIVKQHTVVGWNILTHAKDRLSESDYWSMAADIARHHHEHWDGSGYPDGLEGEHIPLAARIVAVADAFDAFTATTPLSPVSAVLSAMERITAESGRRFDPAVIEALRCRRDDFRQAVERFANGYPFTSNTELVGIAEGAAAEFHNVDHIEHAVLEDFLVEEYARAVQ